MPHTPINFRMQIDNLNLRIKTNQINYNFIHAQLLRVSLMHMKGVHLRSQVITINAHYCGVTFVK